MRCFTGYELIDPADAGVMAGHNQNMPPAQGNFAGAGHVGAAVPVDWDEGLMDAIQYFLPGMVLSVLICFCLVGGSTLLVCVIPTDAPLDGHVGQVTPPPAAAPIGACCHPPNQQRGCTHHPRFVTSNAETIPDI